MLAFVLALLAAPPEMTTFVSPAFSIAVLKGDEDRRGTSGEGMLEVKTLPASQVLYWRVSTSSLEERAKHERGLVQKAAEQGVSVRLDPDFRKDKVGAANALAWSADIEKTHFESTIVDCTSHQVLLTTMGPNAKAVREIHAASLAKLVCTPPPAPATK